MDACGSWLNSPPRSGRYVKGKEETIAQISRQLFDIESMRDDEPIVPSSSFLLLLLLLLLFYFLTKDNNLWQPTHTRLLHSYQTKYGIESIDDCCNV